MLGIFLWQLIEKHNQIWFNPKQNSLVTVLKRPMAVLTSSGDSLSLKLFSFSLSVFSLRERSFSTSWKAHLYSYGSMRLKSSKFISTGMITDFSTSFLKFHNVSLALSYEFNLSASHLARKTIRLSRPEITCLLLSPGREPTLLKLNLGKQLIKIDRERGRIVSIALREIGVYHWQNRRN